MNLKSETELKVIKIPKRHPYAQGRTKFESMNKKKQKKTPQK